jgi:hypothetical protein
MEKMDYLFARLQRSTFRSRFHLGSKERQYCVEKGPETIDQHAADFIARRLAPAQIANDGKQTPMRGIRCLSPSMPPPPAVAAVWKSGTPFRRPRADDREQRYVVQVIHRWLVIQMNSSGGNNAHLSAGYA